MATSVDQTPATTASGADEVIRTELLTKVYPGDIRAVDELEFTYTFPDTVIAAFCEMLSAPPTVGSRT